MGLKFGTINEVDPANGRAKVKWEENSGITSPWLRIAIRNSKDNKEECWFDVNEHVACLMSDDMLTGVILFAIYDNNNLPEVGDQDIWQKKFKDGTIIKYHRAQHKLTVDGSNLDIEVNCNSVDITAPGGTSIDGDLTVSGSISANGNIHADGNVSAGGNVQATGDVTAGGGAISLIGHKHIVTAAPGITGPSIP